MRKKIGVIMFIVLAVALVFPVKAAIVFSDDFNRSDGPLGSDWVDVYGVWAIENIEANQVNEDSMYARTIAGDAWNDCFIEVKAIRTSGSWGWIGLLFRVLDDNNFYIWSLKDGSHYVGKYIEGSWRAIQTWTPIGVDVDVWNTLKIELLQDSISLWLNGVNVGSFVDNYRLSGKIGLASNYCRARFDNMLVDNPGLPGNVVPEPATAIVSLLLIGGLASYALIRKRQAIVPARPFN